MPLIDLAPTPLDTPFVGLPPDATADQQAAHEQAAPEFSQTLGAAWRQSNQIGSFLSRQDSGMPGDQELGFDAWAAIKGTPYEEHWDSFADIHNRKALGMRKAQIDMETKDRQTMAAAGWPGFFASVGAGALDPTMLLPVGGAINKISGGVSVARTALATGADVATAVAVQEAGLHASQRLRTGEESAWAIGSSALLGTFLGAGAAALLSHGEQRAVEAAIDRLRQSGGSPILSDIAESGARAPLEMPGAPQAGGAEAVVPVTREDLTVAGGAARRVAEATAELNPNLRLNTSPSTEARKIGQQLAENTLFQNQHAEGESLGPAAETLMRTTMHARMADAQAAHNAAFLAGRKAGMQMTRAQFEDAVGEAMRRGDEGENDFVTQAAQDWRKRMFDPFKEEAINEGLLPADVKVDTADSYFRRLYNQQMLTARESDFKSRVVSHYDGLLQSEYAGDVERHASRVDTLNTEAADLKLSPEDRQATLASLEQEQQQLYGNGPEHVDRADQIARLREDMAAAREAGNKEAYKVAQEQAARLRAEGGEQFQAFLRQRANLNARMRNVEMNVAGLAERADTVLQSLADIAEANQRSMQRLITKGRVFERDAQRLDPAKFAAKVDDLRTGIADQAARAQKAADRARKGVEKIAADAERRAAKADKEAQKATAEAGVAQADEVAAKKATASHARGEAVAARSKRDADIKARLEKEATSQTARAERMSRLADRLEQAQSLDPEAMLAEVRAGVDRMAAEVSNLSLSRGEKAQRLLDRLKSLDPKRIEDRLKAIEDLQKDFERKFYEKWEIDRGAAGADLSKSSDIVKLRKALKDAQDAGDATAIRAARAELRDKTPSFAEYSRDIANAVYEKLTGRGFDNNMPDNLVPATRGPLKERTFHIPDHVIEPFLESNVIHVAHDYARKMASEIELTRRFGSADMKEPLQRITNEYAGLRQQIAEAKTIGEMRAIADRNPGAVKWLKEKAFKPDMESTREGLLSYLTRSERQDAEDVQAMRDLLRGTYKKANMNNVWGRVARGVLTFNYITRLGGVLLANISEVFRPAMVYGMKSLMQEGYGSLLTGAKRAAVGMSVHEAQLAGQVVERVIQHRVASFAEMGDPYRAGTAIERLLDQGSRVASRWNFLTQWTDGMKAITSVLAQNRMLRALRDGGEDRLLAYLGMDPAMRVRVADQVAKHAEEIEGVMVANTEKWDDVQAVRTYRAAMSKDVDSVIVTRSVGDVPLFANTPTGKLITQFKSFALASHQRVLLRGLQDNQARFFGGMIAMTAMGGLATYLRAISSNRLDKVSQNNPGWWLAEGIDQTGIFSVPMELANILEKPTGINVLKDPLRVAGGALTGSTKGPATLRYGSRGDFGALLGPGMGQMDDLFTVIKTLSSAATGGDVQSGQKKAAVDAALRQTPFYSYPGMRQMIEYLAKPAAYSAVGAK